MLASNLTVAELIHYAELGEVEDFAPEHAARIAGHIAFNKPVNLPELSNDEPQPAFKVNP